MGESTGNVNIDSGGHMGGFLSGLLLGLWVPKAMVPSNYT